MRNKIKQENKVSTLRRINDVPKVDLKKKFNEKLD
jgi:hypothetical protein